LTGHFPKCIIKKTGKGQVSIKQPRATRGGTWKIGEGLELECYVMDNKQLQKVIALMRVSDTWEEFENLFDKATNRKD
jgi:hypothetical protein